MGMIQWTPAKLEALKERYRVARDSGAETFKFEGMVVLGTYAHYLIEYLEEKFGVKDECK